MDRWGGLKRILQCNTGDVLISNLCSTLQYRYCTRAVEFLSCRHDNPPQSGKNKHGKVKEVERVFKFIIFILDIPTRRLLAKNSCEIRYFSLYSYPPCLSFTFQYSLFSFWGPHSQLTPRYSSMWFVGVSLDKSVFLVTSVNLSWSFFWKVG